MTPTRPEHAASPVEDRALDHDIDTSAAPELTPGGAVLRWVAVGALFFGLIVSIELIGDGFKGATAGQAEQLFDFAANPVVGLIVGLLATTLIQSSSTTTAIIVGLVAGGMPVGIAVPMVMGANLGTTVTNTLAALGTMGQREPFRRAFSAATVHDFFNLFAVAIFLPLEILTGFLGKTAAALAGLFQGADGADTDKADVLSMVVHPVAGLIRGPVAALGLSEMAEGIVLAAVGALGVLLIVRFLGMVLGRLMVGRAKALLHGSVGRGPVAGIASGTAVTVLAQSSSVTTSLMVPLAASNAITLRQIFPFTVGANIGTTATALIAAMAAEEHAEAALTIAFVHLLFNVIAALVIYGIPFLREIPLAGATWLANAATANKWFVVAWVVGVFFVLPGLVLAISELI